MCIFNFIYFFEKVVVVVVVVVGGGYPPPSPPARALERSITQSSFSYGTELSFWKPILNVYLRSWQFNFFQRGYFDPTCSEIKGRWGITSVTDHEIQARVEARDTYKKGSRTGVFSSCMISRFYFSWVVNLINLFFPRVPWPKGQGCPVKKLKLLIDNRDFITYFSRDFSIICNL